MSQFIPNLFEETKETDRIELDFSPTVLRTERGVEERATIAKFAGSSQDRDILVESFKEGGDESVNTEIGSSVALREQKTRKELLETLAANKDPMFNEVAEGMILMPEKDYNTNAVEKEFGKKVAEYVGIGSAVLPSLMEEAPQVADATMDAMEEFSTKAAIVRNVVDQKVAQWQNKGILSKGLSIGVTLIPFGTWIARQNAVDNAKTSSILPGSNVKEQIAYLWSLPTDEMEVALKEAIEDVSTFSDFDGMLFAQAFIEYSGSEEFIDNAFGVVDVASLIPVAKVGQLTKAAVNTAKGTAKAVIESGPDVAKIANAVADTEKAAISSVVKSGADLGKPLSKVEDLEVTLPSMLRVEDVFSSTKNVSSGTLNKLQEAAVLRASIATKAIENGRALDTLTEAERAMLAQEAVDEIRKVHTSIKDSISNVDIIKAENTLENVDKVELTFGKQDGTLFASEQSAKTWMNRHLQFKDAEIVPVGERFAIKLTKPIAQTNIQSIQIAADAKTPDAVGSFFRSLQSDGYNVALQQVKDRRTTSDLSERMGRIIEVVGEPITKLSNKNSKEVQKVLSSVRDKIHPDGKRRWPTMDEFVEEFRRLNDKLPNDGQIESYVAYRQLYELDYVLRDMSLLKHKMRLGVEKWNFEGVKDVTEGIQKKEIPFGSSDYFSVVALDKNGKVIKKGTNRTSVENQKFFQEMLDKGWTLVQSFNGSSKINDTTRATFILAEAPKRSQLRFGESLGYNPGGHVISKYPFYIKQGRMRNSSSGGRQYLGDKTIWNVSSMKEGQEIVEHLEAARLLKKANKTKEFSEYISKNLPEMTEADWKRIDVNVPFGVTRSGQRLVDGNFYKQGTDFDLDMTHNPYNLSSQLDGRFVGQRQDQTVDAILSEHDSVIRIDKADLVEPFEAMQIGVRSAVDNKVMGEYVYKSANTFVREFSDILDVSPVELQRNPIAVINELKFKRGADKRAVEKAKKVASVINNFLGSPTETSRRLQIVKESLAEAALSRFGKNSPITKFVDERLVHTINDPSAYFRSIAFHTKMGLFNPKQLLLQSQIFTQVASVGGLKNALEAIPAYMYSHGLKLTAKPEMVEDAAKRVASIPGSSWTKEEFIESHNALVESGWDIIGGSVAWRDFYEGPSVMKNQWSKFLDKGTVFFKKGEQLGRLTAWHVSYKNWKAANPGKKLDRAGKEWISLRASDLTANMTRDMNAVWQRGFLSVPTQFWGFQARVFEQMVSPASRLTAKERMRLFAGISMMYGVPVGMGAGTMFVPVSDMVKTYLMENGMDEVVEGNPAFEAIRDGLLSTSVEMLTGMDFDTTPYGPAGNPFVADLLQGNLEWFEMMGGASASIVAQGLSEFFPALGTIVDGINVDTPGDVFKITEGDIIDLMGSLQIATVDNAIKLHKALSTGRWVSRNETILGDISVSEALISSISGIQPEHITDTFLRLESGQKIRNLIRGAQKEISQDYRRARLALEKGDMDTFETYMKRARLKGIENGLTQAQMSQAYKSGFSFETLEESSIDTLNRYVLEHKKRVERGNK